MAKTARNRNNRPLKKSVEIRNRWLETSQLDSFSFRLPNLVLRAHFYYKLVDKPPYEINAHQHTHWEISIIAHGSSKYHFPEQRKTLSVQNSQWLIIPPQITHRWSMSKGPLVINSWQVGITAEDTRGEDLLAEARKRVTNAGFLLPVLPIETRADTLLWDVTGQPSLGATIGCMTSGFARILIASVLTRLVHWPDEHSEAGAGQRGAGGAALSERIASFVESNLQHNIAIGDIESHFHLSGRHLNRLFREKFNMPIGQYMRERRMELGRRWLATTQRSIKDIAFSLGYRTQGQFCRYFLLRFGATPTEYRRKSCRKTAD